MIKYCKYITIGDKKKTVFYIISYNDVNKVVPYYSIVESFILM